MVAEALVAATDVAAPTRQQLAAAFALLCERLRARLDPLFGSAAVAALFARALRMAAAEFPWLTEVVPPGGERCLPEGLARAAEHCDVKVVQDGLSAVLAGEIALLSAFIGDDLVATLVHDAWGGEPPRGPAGNKDPQ